MTVSIDEANKVNIIIWCHKKSYVDENQFVELLRKHLTDNQIVAVLGVIDETCPHCWNADEDCQCWNDD